MLQLLRSPRGQITSLIVEDSFHSGSTSSSLSVPSLLNSGSGAGSGCPPSPSPPISSPPHHSPSSSPSHGLSPHPLLLSSPLSSSFSIHPPGSTPNPKPPIRSTPLSKRTNLLSSFNLSSPPPQPQQQQNFNVNLQSISPSASSNAPSSTMTNPTITATPFHKTPNSLAALSGLTQLAGILATPISIDLFQANDKRNMDKPPPTPLTSVPVGYNNGISPATQKAAEILATATSLTNGNAMDPPPPISFHLVNDTDPSPVKSSDAEGLKDFSQSLDNTTGSSSNSVASSLPSLKGSGNGNGAAEGDSPSLTSASSSINTILNSTGTNISGNNLPSFLTSHPPYGQKMKFGASGILIEPNGNNAQQSMDPLKSRLLNKSAGRDSDAETKSSTSSLPSSSGLGPQLKFSCPECNKLFPSNSALSMHRLVHTGEKPHVCPVESCNRAFRQKGHLVSHMRKHTGEKPYECRVGTCKKKFKDKSGLNTHIKRCHHGDDKTHGNEEDEDNDGGDEEGESRRLANKIKRKRAKRSASPPSHFALLQDAMNSLNNQTGDNDTDEEGTSSNDNEDGDNDNSDDDGSSGRSSSGSGGDENGTNSENNEETDDDNQPLQQQENSPIMSFVGKVAEGGIKKRKRNENEQLTKKMVG